MKKFFLSFEKKDFIVLLSAAAFFVLMAALGLPLPFGDDLFYVGAAMHYVQTGQMANPLITEWSMRAADRFFLQPPFFFYTLALWLKGFGISAFSMISFQTLCHWLFMFFSYLILKKFRFSTAVFFALLAIYAPVGYAVGLRHDVLGTLFLVAGLYFLFLGNKSTDFLGGFLLTASTLAWPVTTAYAFLAVVPLFVRKESGKINLSHFISTALGAASAMLLALALIDFRLHDFVNDFLWHAQLRGVKPEKLWWYLGWIFSRDPASFLRFSSAVSIAFCIAAILLHSKITTAEKAGVLAALATLALNIFLYIAPIYTIWLLGAQIYGLICLVHFRNRLFLPVRILLAFSLGLLVLINLALFVIYNFFNAPANTEVYARARQVAAEAAAAGKTVVVDDATARYVFDYKLPENTRAFVYMHPPPIPYPDSLSRRKPGHVWIIATGFAGWYLQDLPKEKLQLFGRTFNSVYTEFKTVQIFGENEK